MYRLSVTGDIGLYLECKRCFYLDKVKKIKRPDSIFPSLPSGMDRILKEHFDRFMLKGEIPPEIRDHDHIKDCKLFDDINLLNSWRSKSKGLEYKDQVTQIILRGCVDNIIKKGQKLIVLDYKTRGYPLRENTHSYYQVQMDFYNFLLNHNGYQTEDYALLLFYYPNKVMYTGEVVFDTKLVKIKIDAQKAKQILDGAISTLQGNLPQKNPKCEFCNWDKKEFQTDLLNI